MKLLDGKMKKFKTIMMALILTMFSIQMAFAQWTISGTVTGDEVEGVNITLSGDADEATVTTSGGTYAFTVANGTYTVTARLDGYNFSPGGISSINVLDADKPNLDFVSNVRLRYVYGYVSGDILADVEVIIWSLNCGLTDPVVILTTDANGFWDFTSVEDGRWLLNVAAPGYSFLPNNGAGWMDLPKDPSLSYDFTATED